MKLALRARSINKRVTLFATAFVLAVSSLTASVPFILSKDVSAAPFGTDIIRAANTQGWGTGTSSNGGASSFVTDNTAPYGNGAIEFTTTSSNNSRAQRTKSFSPNIALSSVNTLSYSTKYVSGAPSAGVALQITINGLTGSLSSTTLVYEPYWNNGGTVDTTGAWQNWNTLAGGKFWSTTTVAGFTNGAGGPPFYTIDQVKAAHPNAKITSMKLNIGTYNPSWVVRADGINLNGTIYDFEPVAAPLAATPQNLRFNDSDVCGFITNVNSVTPKWDAAANAVSYNYKAILDGVEVYATNVGNVTSITGAFGGEGLSSFSVQSVNADGITSAWAPACEATYDATAPVVTNTAQQFEVQQNGRYAVTLTFNEKIDTNSLEQGWYEVAGSDQKQFVKRYYSTQEFTANFKDLAGNSVAHTFTISPVANDSPLVVFNTPTPTDNTFVAGTITSNVTATDDWGMGSYYLRFWKDAYEVANNGTLVHQCYSAPGAFLLGASVNANCSFNTTTVANGTKIVMSAQFLDGHQAWGSALRTVTVDNQKPNTFEITSPSDGASISGDLTVTGTATDTISDIASVDYNIRNVTGFGGTTYGSAVVPFTDANYNSTTDTWDFTETGLADGYYRVAVRTTDNAGNFKARHIDVLIDSVAPDAPVLTARTPSGTEMNDGGVTNSYEVVADWNDVSGTSSYIYKYWNSIPGNEWTEANPYTVNGLDSSETAGVFNQGEGTHFMQVFAVDAAGNVSVGSNIFEITYDVSAPTVTLNGLVDNVTTPTISGKAFGGATAVLLTINANPAVEVPVTGEDWSYTVLTPLVAGIYNISVVAKDAAGNQSPAPAIGTMTIASLPTGIPVAPVQNNANNEDGDGEDEDEVVTLIVPTITGPAGALGVDTDNNGNNTDNNNGEVEGASTLNNLAQAVDSESNQGYWLGLAWYWWVLIAAGVATIIWWIIAAIRRRGTA